MPAPLKYDNFAKGTISGSHTTATTVFNLVAGHGNRFTDSPRLCVVWEASTFDDPADAFHNVPSKAEIVKQNADATANQMPTVIRAQENTVALDMTDVSKTYKIMGVATETFFRNQLLWENVVTHGATGDGTTDDSSAVIAAFDAAIAQGGGTAVFFPNGSYNLATWPAAGKSFGTPIRVIGESKGVTLTGLATADFLDIDADVEVENIGFSGWDAVFDLDALSTNIESVVIRQCKSDGAVNFVNWGTPTAGGIVDSLEIKDNEILNTTGIVCDLEGEWKCCNVRGNYVRGGLRCFHFGNNTFADQGDWPHVHCTDNTITNLASTSATEAVGIISYGTDSVITGNVIDGVDGGSTAGEAWGIYTKSLRTSVCNNVVKGVDGSANSIGGRGINIKGRPKGDTGAPQGYNNTIVGNVVDMGDLAKSSGIFLSNSDLICCGNVVEGVQSDGIATFSDATIDNDRIQIIGNKVFVTTVGTSVGIRLVSRGDYFQVIGNRVQGAFEGIRMTPAFGSPKGTIISGNSLTGPGGSPDGDGSHGISISPGTAITVSHIHIKDNFIEDYAGTSAHGILFAGAGSIDRVWVAGNTYRNNTNDITVSTVPTNLIRELDGGGQLDFEQNVKIGDGAWDGEHLLLGTTHLWIQATGELRRKVGAPASDTDGTQIG